MTAGENPDTPLPIYATSPRPRRVKRVWLATFLASMAACLSVTLIGFILLGITDALFGILGMGGLAVGQRGLIGGIAAGLQLAAYNFFLFFITVPAAALALGLSVGRFPHQGITALKSYMRWGAIWGAILVGGVTFFFGWFGGAEAAFGALLSGSFVGGLAGAFCGFLMHKIINPVRQLSDVDVNVF
jgi:hypothetical protein